MMASELIKLLAEEMATDGDVEVFYYDAEFQTCPAEKLDWSTERDSHMNNGNRFLIIHQGNYCE